MLTKRFGGGVVVGIGVLLATQWVAMRSPLSAQTIPIDSNDIAGVVTGPNGPEAGVWVIAETTALPTRFVRIVVTDDRGRYLLPDLPAASYEVWVRGYGLVDSPHTTTSPGKHLDLKAVKAPDARAAAQYYPAGYWFSLLRPPAKSEFPGTGPEGNGIAPNMHRPGAVAAHTQVRQLLGLPPARQQGHARDSGGARTLRQVDGRVAAAGAVRAGGQPDAGHAQPVRPQPRGRDVRRLDRPHRGGRSATGAAAAAGHRAQRRDYRMGLGRPEGVSARRGVDGPAQSDGERERADLRLAGAEHGLSAGAGSGAQHDHARATDGARSATEPAQGPTELQPSPYWGAEVLWTSRNNVHNPMFDEKGRVWITSTVRPPDNPAFCKAGSTHPSAKVFPLRGRGGSWRCTIRRRRSSRTSARASARTT